MIDELVDDVPKPLDGQLEFEWLLSAQYGVEELDIVAI